MGCQYRLEPSRAARDVAGKGVKDREKAEIHCIAQNNIQHVEDLSNRYAEADLVPENHVLVDSSRRPRKLLIGLHNRSIDDR